MAVPIEPAALRTLKKIFVSCSPTIPELALAKILSFNRLSSLVTFEAILQDDSYIIPNTVLGRLEKYALDNKFEVINQKMVYFFFGGPAHLESVKNAGSPNPDLSYEEMIVAHMLIPAIITGSSTITAKSLQSDVVLENLVDPDNKLENGDVALIHFATIIEVNPPSRFVKELLKEQSHFLKESLKAVEVITYKETTESTRERIARYLK